MTTNGTGSSALQATTDNFTKLHASVAQFCGLRGAQPNFNTVVAHMHALCGAIDELEGSGVLPSDIRQVIQPAVAAQGESPLIGRLQTWPRGYPGDFETIELLLHGRNDAPAHSLAHACERYVLNSAPAYQHRNKLAFQSSLIRSICESAEKPRILVLAAGSGADLVAASSALLRSRAHVVVNDIDHDALALCRMRLADLGERVTFIGGNVLRSIAAMSHHGPFDLVLVGGLLDYVSGVHARRLLRRLSPSVRTGGIVYFSNISTDNPYRTWMRYFGNWNLIERTSEEVSSLAMALGNYTQISVELDVSGLCFLVVATKGRPDGH